MKRENGIINGEYSADYKACGGKLLRVRLLVHNNIIKDIKVTGDFFIHPEECIEELEQLLKHTKILENNVRYKIKKFYDKDVMVVGAEIEDFVTLIMSAIDPSGYSR